MRFLLVTEGSRGAGAFLSFFVGLYLTTAITSGCGEQHADAIAPRLENTFESPEAVSRAVLSALEAGDYENLRRYALSEEEFGSVVWPELPSSRPDRNLPLSYVWGDLNQKANYCFKRLVDTEGGRHYDLVRLEFEGVISPYDSYRVYRDARLVVRDEYGREKRVDFFGSVIERDGRFKLFSYYVD